ncbi:gamma-glutamylcyclotransferase family protein [Kineococcus sp. SYSU DK002]|uniref:gamma-glutamylcyclotransferase family protein n=1 Tax=Kineococcus sp. SYSU DK002 TaxID=3383123 RepID=UPI003D7D29D3
MSGGDRLPFFVYGTLRRGGGNHAWALAGRTVSERAAVLDGAHMHEGPGYPFVVPGGPGGVIGELVEVLPAHHSQVLADLDRLEGFVPGGSSNLYDRVVVEVRTADGTLVPALTYVAAERLRERVRTLPPVPSGDWFGTRRMTP